MFELAEKTGIPVTTTLMGIGGFPGTHPQALHMLGMHGSVYANLAVSEADLLLAFGVRFDDRVTGKVSEFAKHGKIVHIDIDPSEINKIKGADLASVSDMKYALSELNKVVKAPADLSPWTERIAGWKKADPFKFDEQAEAILPQHAIHELWRLTKDRDTIVATGVGQHQMWSAQFYQFDKPRTWLSSAGLGTMGFGLPAAMGAQVAHPDKLVVDIDGDGSLQMNIQEFGTCHCEKIPVKVLLLNNQHLGMVVQWEDRFHGANRAHTYLGPIDNPEAIGKGEGIGPEARYPELRDDCRGVWLESPARDEEIGTHRSPSGNDRLVRALPPRRGRALSGTRVAHDPVRRYGSRTDQGIVAVEIGMACSNTGRKLRCSKSTCLPAGDVPSESPQQ